MAAKVGLQRVYAITGQESLLVREALARLKVEAGVNGADAFDLAELDGASASASEISDAVSTAPFLAERRTVIVERANKLRAEEADRLNKSIPNLPASALLILVFEPPEDDRKGMSALSRSLVATAKKGGESIDCTSLPKERLLVELQKRADAIGAKLTREGANALAEVTSDGLTDSVAELEKCALFAAGGPVGRDIVLKVAAPSREWKVFQLLDAVCRGQLGPALTHLKYLLGETPKIEEAAMRNLFPLLHRQLRMLWQAKACALEKVAPSQAPNLLPQQHNLASANDYARQQAAKLAGNLTLEHISRMMRALAEADMRLKGQLPAAFARESLERLLAELASIAGSR